MEKKREYLCLDVGDTIVRIYVYYFIYRLFIKKGLSLLSLKRDFKPKDVSFVKDPVVLTNNDYSIDYNRINESRYNESLINFIQTIEKNFSKSNLNIFYNNINNLSISKNFLVLLIGGSGAYNAKKNNIKLVTSGSLYHELFHMASSYDNKQTGDAFCGFYQTSKRLYDNIGYGLNEGYTQLLTERYFGCNNNEASYSFEQKIAGEVEKLVGKEKMESFYLKADLKGIIMELSKYASLSDIMKFICLLDLVSKHSSEIFIFKNKKMQQSVYFIYDFLLNIHDEKIKHQSRNIDVTFGDLKREHNEYKHSLGLTSKIFLKEYDNFSHENNPKILSKTL